MEDLRIGVMFGLLEKNRFETACCNVLKMTRYLQRIKGIKEGCRQMSAMAVGVPTEFWYRYGWMAFHK